MQKLRVANVVTTSEQLKDVLDRFMAVDEFVFDVETRGEYRGHAPRAVVSWLALASSCGTYAIPMGHPNGRMVWKARQRRVPRVDADGNFILTPTGKKSVTIETLPPVFDPAPKQLFPQEVFATLKPLFFDESKRKIGHNVKFDVTAIAKYYDGQVIPGPWGDTITAQHLIDPARPSYTLDASVKRTYGATYDDGKLGRIGVDMFDLWTVAKYAMMDASFTWWLWNDYYPKLAERSLRGVFRMEMDVIRVLVDMERAGALVDVERLHELDVELTEQCAKLKQHLYDIAGNVWNVDNPAAAGNFVYKVCKHKVIHKTAKTNKPSTKAEHLAVYAATDERVALLVKYRERAKLKGTYVDSYLGRNTKRGSEEQRVYLVDGTTLHPSFLPWGAATGRFSCVSGDTLLRTYRGTFRMDTYEPRAGDQVQAHDGSWRNVLGKFYQGVDKMTLVKLANGAQLKCTANHRVLTPIGWREVGELRPGEEVFTDECFQEFYEHPSEPATGGSFVPVVTQADDLRRGFCSWYLPAHGVRHPQGWVVGETVQVGAGAAVLALEDGSQEPDARKDGSGAPQLHRGHRDEGRVPTAQGQRALRVGSPFGYGGGPWPEAPAEEVRRTPPRREQAEQLGRQPGLGDEQWAPEAARAHGWKTTQVESTHPLGESHCWDIAVEGAHSYVTHGFLSHNCAAPNLQNLPRHHEEDPDSSIRSLFVVEKGEIMIVADYSQIELRFIAHFAKDPAMIKAFLDGIDIHAATAATMLGKRPEDLSAEERTLYGKVINFATSFGAGPDQVAMQAKVSRDKAKEFLDLYARRFPRVMAWKRQVVRDAMRFRPAHVRTISGRIRVLNELFAEDWRVRSRAERQAVNTIVQGSAADVCKLAMIKLHRAFQEEPDKGAKLRLTVHDELVSTVPEEHADWALETVRTAMTDPYEISVPLTVDAKTCYRWSEGK